MIFSFKILYTGKGTCLGMKSNTRINKWLELTIPKGSKISKIAAGHDGQHIIMVTEDGSVLFSGTAKRGEDGDNSELTWFYDYSSHLHILK